MSHGDVTYVLELGDLALAHVVAVSRIEPASPCLKARLIDDINDSRSFVVYLLALLELGVALVAGVRPLASSRSLRHWASEGDGGDSRDEDKRKLHLGGTIENEVEVRVCRSVSVVCGVILWYKGGSYIEEKRR
jgi:hypothetical protein